MRRRAVLAGVAGVAGFAATGGAVRAYRRANPPTPGPLTDVGVESWLARGDPDARPENPPEVTVSGDGTGVTIDGYLYVEEDHQAKIATVDHDTATDELSVRVDTYRPLVSHLEWQTDRLDAYGRLAYVVDLTFESLPARVTAVEVGAYERPRSTTVET